MKDTKESPSKPGGKFDDLFDDLKDTLDNSVYNTKYEKVDETQWASKKSNDSYFSLDYNSDPDSDYSNASEETIKESRESKEPKESSFRNDSDTVSEIFDALNNQTFEEPKKSERVDKPKRTERTESRERIPRVTPTQSAFDDVKRASKRTSPKVTEKPEETDNIENIEEVYDNQDSQDNFENLENYEDYDDYEDDVNPDNADMDLELLKAIGIGQDNVTADEEFQPGMPETVFKNKSREIKIQNDKAIQKKAAAQASRIFNKVTDKEYTDREQINDIFAAYRKSIFSELLKLAAGICLFLILFYMETAPYLKWSMPNVLNINYFNLPYIWVDMQILLLVAALNFNSLVYGVKSMLNSNINVYSISVFFFAVPFINTILTLFLRGGEVSSSSPNIVLYNSIGVYGMILISIYNLLDMNSEITSFKTVSSKKPKFALNVIQPSQYRKSAKPSKSSQPNQASTQFEPQYSSARLEAELFRDVIESDTPVGGITKTPFISNFFSRTYKDKHNGGLIKYFIYISLVLALGLFIVFMGISKDKDLYVVLSSVTALILGSVPLCSFIIEIYPVYRAQKKAHSIGSAFIGGKSIEESSDAPIISLYDRDIFPADQMKLSGIKVYGNHRIESVMQNLCVIFDKLNMIPADTFKASTNFDNNFNKNIKIINIAAYGICYVSNNQKLFLGTAEYISNIGLSPNYDANFDDQFVKSSGSIMFLASQNEVIAKIYVKYEITADFYDIIKNIRKINACLCIRTFDPNIDDELILKLGNLKKYPVKVLKLKNPADVYETPENIDASPVVSKQSVKSLISAILIADRTKNIMKSNVLIQTVAFASSLLLAIILGFAGQLWGINAGHLFLLQTFWFLPVFVLLGITP